jgi:CheY-like chemotaxis protein
MHLTQMSEVASAPVLIVEDDESYRHALEWLLQTGGYTSVSVGSANEALNYLVTGTPPCLIVLDLMLPDISGDALLATIRSDATLATIPVVVVTGQSEPPALPGVHATLMKGMAPDALLGAVDAACGRTASHGSN